MKKVVVGVLAATGLALGSQANAAQYVLNQDNCSAHCIAAPATNDGAVDVTSIVGGLHIVVTLGPDIFFNRAGAGHDALGFDLLSDPSVTLQNFVETRSDGVTHPTGDFGLGASTLPPLSESGGGAFNNHQFGTGAAGFGYGFDWIGSVKSNGSLFTTGIDKLSFDVLGSGLTLGNTGGAPPIFFSVDVARLNADHVAVATGLVGATLVTAHAPEPVTWVMMVVGFGGVGALLRHRRRQGAAAAIA